MIRREYIAIQNVMGIKGSRVRFLSDALRANCMTGGTKTEQFARCLRAGGSSRAVLQTCKLLIGNSLGSCQEKRPFYCQGGSPYAKPNTT